MAVDPNNPNVVYVGTPQNGLVRYDRWRRQLAKSERGAGERAGCSGQYPGITGIVFDPTLRRHAAEKPIPSLRQAMAHGVYESTNGGASWIALSGGPSDVEYAAISSTGVYYAIGNNNTSLWRYMNGAWTEL